MGERGLIAIRWPSGKKALIARDDYDPARDTLWEEPSDAMQGREEEKLQEIAPKRRGRTRRG